MSKLKLAIVSILLLVLLVEVSGQNFPVRVTPIITPPYSPFLTDYTDPGSDKLTLQVMLNDITVSSYRCKFRLAIEGVNISITTNPNYLPAPITLQGGVPEIIYGSDIIDYFNPANLVYKGITQKEIEKNGNKLPEGVYRFTFEVLDYNRNLVVSNKGTVTAWMLLNDPPFINLPANNAKLKPFDPQNIVFQWTPRHRGSPNSAFTTEYEVKLVEIWPKGRNPYDAINTTRPIFETTTDATMVVYGPAETPLVLGREYALQVKAKDTGGKDLFKNNGYSEVVKFTYGDECPLPTSLLAEDIGTVKARIKWQGNGMNTAYTLRYRQKQQDAAWFEEHTNQSYFNAMGMQPGTVYEYEVGGECETFKSAYVGGQVFTTLIEDPNAFVCGDPNALPKLDGSPPLPALMINDFIHAGGFDVVVNSATGSNGQFSGTGQAIVPWFNSAKVRVTFENINVNKSYQLTGGTIKSVWDKNSKLLKTIQQTAAKDSTLSADLKNQVITFAADTLVSVSGAIISVGTNSDGDIVVLTNEGTTITLEKGKYYAVADEVGNGYLIDKEGNITKTTAKDASLANDRGQREYSDDPNLSVRFAKATTTVYGFDEKREGTLAENYQLLESGKYVAWKALSTTQADPIQVIAEGTTDLTKLNYRREGFSTEDVAVSSDPSIISLFGKPNGSVEELMALYQESDTSQQRIAGKLNMVSYDGQTKNLVLISVNETKLEVLTTTIATQLNEAYNQAVVDWNVNEVQSLTVSDINKAEIDDGSSGLLSNYTGDMRKVINAYLKEHTLTANTYYLFIVENSKSEGLLGFMPRNKQAGFIFTKAHLNKSEIPHTIAHELGHGAFHLRHTFLEYTSLAQNSTNNLMDYKGGAALNKYQWDHIHNPETVIGLFEDDEEAFMLKPYWERAALVLQEYLDDKDFYDEVTLTCTGNKCTIKTKVFIATNVSIEQEFTFDSGQKEEKIFELLVFTYKVPYWEAREPFTQGFWEKAKNYLLIQDDKIARGEGWAVGYANFVADVVTGSTGVPTIYGWITGEHWRTGDELAWWEQVIGVVDVLPAEALAKAGISAMVIKIGSKYFDFAQVTQVTRSFLIGARQAGLKVVMESTNEIKIFANEGGRQIGRFLSGVLEEVYWKYGEKFLARIANVQYMVDQNTKSIVTGTLEIVEKAGEVGIRQANDIWLLAKQTLGKAADSKILGDNLVTVGNARPANSAAHHIVAGSESYISAERARNILIREGIDINEAANGVFLPRGSKYVIDSATPHSRVHTNKYYDELFRRLSEATPGKIREELSDIATELLMGKFPF